MALAEGFDVFTEPARRSVPWLVSHLLMVVSPQKRDEFETFLLEGRTPQDQAVEQSAAAYLSQLGF